MRLRRAFLALAIPAMVMLAEMPAQTAKAETLVTALSTHRVQISSSYTGAQLVIFGSIERDGRTMARGDPYDLVITVRGPRKTHVVREKQPLGPLWINRSQRRFVDAPSFVAIASSRDIDKIADPEQRRKNGIGIENILISPFAGLALDADESIFRDALIRLGSADGLFTTTPLGVTFLSPTLFRAPINLPGVAPPGSYDVEVMLLSGSVPLSRQSTNFEVVTTGIDQRIKLVSQRASLTYGITTILLALFFGWLASVIFRRD
jgi:uncharacterized protein (TIGR02186 family)